MKWLSLGILLITAGVSFYFGVEGGERQDSSYILIALYYGVFGAILTVTAEYWLELK